MNLVDRYLGVFLSKKIKTAYLKNKGDKASALFLTNLNSGLRNDLVKSRVVEAISAKIKSADELMLVAVTKDKKHRFVLNTLSEEITYIGGM